MGARGRLGGKPAARSDHFAKAPLPNGPPGSLAAGGVPESEGRAGFAAVFSSRLGTRRLGAMR
jgi:hypothetical protein